jgi:integrase
MKIIPLLDRAGNVKLWADPRSGWVWDLMGHVSALISFDGVFNRQGTQIAWWHGDHIRDRYGNVVLVRQGAKIEGVNIPRPEKIPLRWLSRSEAARLIWSAWRYREVQKGRQTDRRSRQHVARFILVALYTGTRASAVCGAALQATVGHGWVDLNRGVFYRRAAGRRETKKRQPPVPLPDQLLAHLRRWKRRGQQFAVEWNGNPVQSVDKAFANVVNDAGLGDDDTPHVLRHTAATWLMQAGTDVWEAAGYLGMTIEMLSLRYGHHHPDNLSGAKRAFTRHRKIREAVA